MQWDPIVDHAVQVHPEIVALLTKRLHDLREGFRQNAALLGPPGSGKTSAVLAAIAAAMSARDDRAFTAPAVSPLLVVYCEARRESWAQWAHRFLLATLHGIIGFQPGSLMTSDEPALLRQAHTIAPRTAHTIAELLPQIRATPHERVFRQLLDLPYLAAEETQRPGIIVLDEFHELDHLGIHRPFHELGKRIMLERSMLYILVSSQPLAARRILRERLNLLFGGFELIDVGALDEPASQLLIRDRLRARRLPQPAATFLNWFTHGHAWSLGALLETLALRGGRGDVAPSELLQHLTEELADARRPLSAFCAERLHGLEEGRASQAYLALLTALAGHRGTPRGLAQRAHQTVAETSRQLGRLLEQGLLERHGECYTLESPLWSFWFRHIYLPRRATTLTTVASMRQWVHQRLEEAWHAFLREQAVPPLQRFLHLIDSFQDELVRVETRRCRLPAFAGVRREAIGPGLHQITAEPATGLPWLYFVKETPIDEADITAFAQRSAQLDTRVAQRVAVGLERFETAAQLLAKVSKFWVWHGPALQGLYRLYQLPALQAEP